MNQHPSYFGVLLTFARNSLVRDMSFRGNFIVQCVAAVIWTCMSLAFYLLIFEFTDELGKDTGWHKYQFFVFFATTMIVNSLTNTFFMINTEEFSEMIRTGRLDFVLLKPINTQFVVSLQRVHWSALANGTLGLTLLGWAMIHLDYIPALPQIILYPIYIICGVAIMYSLLISLAATSIWMGRNQSMANFFFYLTTFSRYPMEIYRGPIGNPLRILFTFILPVLIAINVPARMMAKPLSASAWWLSLFAIAATAASLILSRQIFLFALKDYRSASS